MPRRRGRYAGVGQSASPRPGAVAVAEAIRAEAVLPAATRSSPKRGILRRDADPGTLAYGLLAAFHGGTLVARTVQRIPITGIHIPICPFWEWEVKSTPVDSLDRSPCRLMGGTSQYVSAAPPRAGRRMSLKENRT